MSAGQEAPTSSDQQQPSTSHAGGFQQYPPTPNPNHFAHATQHQPLNVSTSAGVPPNVYGGLPRPGSESNWMQQPPPSFYYHAQGPMPPQRSPIPPGHPDGAPPSSQAAPQIVVPRQDGGAPGQPMAQHSPAARRPMSGQPPPGWPPMQQGPSDPNDPNAHQHQQQHPHMPPQYPTQQPMMHPGYQPGMHPPPGYWAPPPHQQRYAQYPGDPNAFQPPPPHMMHPGAPPNAGGHPYYLQVPPHHHYGGGKPSGPEGLPPFSGAPDGHPSHHHQPPTSAPQPPPSNSSGPIDEEEAKRRLQPPAMPPPNVHHVSPGYQPGMHPSMHPGHPNMPGQPPPQMMPPPGMPPGHPMHSAPYNTAPPGMSKSHLLKPQQREAVEKLVGQPSDMIPAQVIPQRRSFFEQVVLMNDQTSEPLTAPPQVSKSTIDLHRLYLAVRKRGGFEQVTKEKSWKTLCTEANPRMTESSAAGYQLRRHYQKYLLALECQETGQNAEELKAFADKLKKKKKEKEPVGSAAGPSTPGQPASTAGPPTPSSIRSAATPTPQHPQQPPPQPSPSSSVGAPPARMSPFPPMHGMPPAAQPPPGYPHPSTDPNAAYYYAQQQQHAAAMAAQQQQQHPGLGPPPQHMQPPHSGAPNWPPQQSPMQPPRFPIAGKQLPPSSSAGPPPADFRRPQMPPGSMAGGTPSAQPSHYFPPPHSGSPSMPSPGSAQRARQQPPPPISQSLPPTTSNAPFMLPGQPSQPPPQSTPSTTTNASFGPPPGAQQPPPTSAAAFPHGPPSGMPPTTATSAPFMHPGHHPGAPVTSNAPFGQMQPPPPHSATQLPPHHPAAGRMPSGHYGGPQLPHHHQQAPAAMGSMSGSQFPPNSLEAMATRSAFNRRRPKLAARDYAGITTRQLCMALRCGQDMELTFALNALTALLYDDTQWPPLQLANEPQLLTLVIEHLRATLAVLYPSDFSVNQTPEMLPMTEEFDEEAYEEKPIMQSRLEKGKEEAIVRKSSHVEAAKYRPKEEEKIFGTSTRPKTQEATAPIASTSALSSKITPPNHVVGNYTLRTRTGKRVYVEPRAKRPMELERLYEELKKGTSNGKAENGEISAAELRRQMETGTGSSVADRMFRTLRTRLNARRSLAKPKISLADVIAAKKSEVNKENEEKEEAADGRTTKPEKEGPEFFYREAHPWEIWDRFAKPDCSLLPRQAPVQERDPALQELTDRALCLSNIIRGFALVSGNEQLMHANRPLLHLAGRLLMLMVGEDEQQRMAREQKTGVTTVGGSEKPEENGAVDVKKEPESEPMDVEQTATAQTTSKDAEKGVPTDSSKTRSQNCPPERDSDRKLLLETANSLRDDAFVVLAQLSHITDLYALESEISEPLLDALLHWAVTTNVQAQDPIAPGVISPRAYVFEIVSKYSLLERNVDLLLSTGSWPRLEEFVRVVCSFITMAEELPTREFAIVILNAISIASESVCIVAAQQTNAIHNLISFLEIADQNMATIASTDGLDALRDNPERIGTSIPMLRRAAQILVNFVHHELCRNPFKTHENKLLSLTVSHVMDSQVANKLTSVLYEIQQVSTAKERKKNGISDDYERLAAMFPSCTWRISDDEQVIPPPPPTTFLPSAPLPSFQPVVDIKPPTFNGLVGAEALNGVEAMPVNGSAKPRRKRLYCHPDGRPMTALERELLRDSDAESVGDEEDMVGGLDNGGHSTPHPSAHEQPHRKTASESVKEKLRNNILRHEHEHEEQLLLQQQQAAAAAAGGTDEPEAKRARIVGNGVISPKCNGDLKVRPTGGPSNPSPKTENGTPPTQSTGSGSMTAVA